MSRTIDQIQRDGMPGDPALPPGVSQRMIDAAAGEDYDWTRYEDLDDAACERLQDSFYDRLGGSIDLFADVVEAMQAGGDKRAELEQRILKSLYEDMESAMESEEVAL